jgi:proteasomal ATPase-associated factor 1
MAAATGAARSRRAPFVQVQCDWELDLFPPSAPAPSRSEGSASAGPAPAGATRVAKFWVMSAREGGEEVFGSAEVKMPASGEVQHAEVVVRNDEDSPPAAGRATDFELQLLAPRRLRLGCARTGAAATVTAPSQTWSHLHGGSLARKGPRRPMLSLDASPLLAPGESRQRLAVSGSVDGSLRAWSFETGLVCREMEGHVGDINCCRFFPSGQVVLSGGADATLRVWSLDLQPHSVAKSYLAPCVLTLKGHALGVADVALIGRGRTFVSCSRDGTVRVWDCSQARCVDVFGTRGREPAAAASLSGPRVSACAVFGGAEEEAAAGAVCAAGAYEDGAVRCFDSRSGREAWRCTLGSDALSALAVAEDKAHLAVGSEFGMVGLFDTRKPSAPLVVARRGDAGITSLLPASADATRLWASTSNGECCLWRLQGDASAIEHELSGADLEPVSRLCRVDAAQIAAACHDGAVRVYSEL